MSTIIDEPLIAGVRFHQTKHTIPAGAYSPKHHHDQTVETYYVLDGEGRLILGGRTVPLKPGVCVEIPIHTPHQIFNDTLLPLVVLSTKDQPKTLQDFHLDT